MYPTKSQAGKSFYYSKCQVCTKFLGVQEEAKLLIGLGKIAWLQMPKGLPECLLGLGLEPPLS